MIAARDLAVFSLGRFPDDLKARRRAEDLAARLHALLDGATMPYGEAGDALGLHDANALRYAATTGTVLIRWAGARQPTVWTVPPAGDDPLKARLELARRHLHVFGPTTPEAFARWAGISAREAVAAFDSLRRSLTAVRTPIGDAWILARDEPAFRADPGPVAPARLLPSGDAYYLLQGDDRAAARPGRRSSQRAVDVAGVARRRAARRRDQRNLAAGERDGDDPGLGPPFPRGTPGRRGGSRGPAAARSAGGDRRPLERLSE